MRKLLQPVACLVIVLFFYSIAFAEDPVANDDFFTVHGTQVLDTGANDVGSAIPETLTQPSHGSVSTNASPTRHTYQPASGYTGPDSFTYRYCWNTQSGQMCSAAATVSIDVVNEAPVTVTSVYNIHWFGFIGPWVTGPEGTDYDPDGDDLKVNDLQILSGPTKGSLQATSIGDYRLYSVNFGESAGTDSFTYQICDNLGACSTGTVQINIAELPPIAVPDFFVLTGTTRHLGLEVNDFTLDGDPFDISADHVTGFTVHGAVSSRATNPEGEDGFYYTRNNGDNHIGIDGFNYALIEPRGAVSNQARITILLLPLDDAEDAGHSCPAYGEPVNVTNGNMWLEQRDYFLPGIGENIEIDRFYNSMLQNNGLFGLGWSTKYDESLQFYDGGLMARLNMPDGKAVYFARQTLSDTFTSASSDVFGQIVQNQDSTYTLAFKDGRSHKFDSGGALLWQKDRNGNQTTLTYNTGGVLTGITDSFGRSLTLTPNSNGTIASVSDSTGNVADYAYYTGTNILKTVTYPDGSKYKFEYDTQNGKTYLTTVKDALDNVLETHTYDSEGRAATSSRDGGVNAYTFDYPVGNKTTITDALGNVSKFEYDKSRGKNVITKSEGVCGCGSGGSEITTYNYDSNLNLVKKTDALSNVTTYKYDHLGNMTEQTDVLGSRKFTYNSRGQVLTYTDQMNGVTTNTYSSSGNLLTTTDPLDHTTTLTYHSNGLPASVTDPRNNTSTIDFDQYGMPEKITTAADTKTFFSFNARGRLTSIMNPFSETTSYEYDVRDRLEKVAYPDTNFVAYAYDTAGRRTSMTDERSHSTTYTYDNAYRLTGVTDALGHTKTFAYDLMSNLTSVTDALGNTTNYEYDDFNRLKKILYPEALPAAERLDERFEYDGVGNMTKKTDTAGRETIYGYDDAYRLETITDPLSNVTHFYYNARSQNTKVKDALDKEYVYTYDALGRVLTETRAGATMTNIYDAAGNRTSRTDYNGQVATYTYDVLNRLTAVAYTGSSNFASYDYDDLSRLTSAENQNGVVTFSYNNRGWPTQTTDVHGETLEYVYDEAGNRVQLKLNNSLLTSYTYDEANRLTVVTDDSSKNYGFEYDDADRLLVKTLPNNVQTLYTYDGMSRLARIQHTNATSTLFDEAYSFNNANQIREIAGLTQTRVFSYDDLDRLTGVSVSSTPVESYDYDNIGNRTSSHLNSFLHYSTSTGYLADTDVFDYTFDNNGSITDRINHQDPGGIINTVSDPTRYTWDEENRLVEVETLEGRGGVANYEYDALGRMVKRTIDHHYVVNHTYDGMDTVVDDSGSSSNRITYQNGPGIDNKLKQKKGVKSNYYLQDHLGSTVIMANETGDAGESNSYDAFGNPSNTSFSTRFQYTGRERDDLTNLYNYRARWYNSGIGRFISEDPIGFAGGDVNLYGYVKNNPVNRVDPSGLHEIDVHYYLTLYLALKNGCFSPSQARSIANGDQDVDDNPSTTPGFGWTEGQRNVNSTRHALTDPSNHPSNLANLWPDASGGDSDDHRNGLGSYLHYLQDMFSHDGYTNPRWGHFSGTHASDKTEMDIVKSLQMAAATSNAINAYSRVQCGCEGHKLSPDDWDQIQNFASAPSGNIFSVSSSTIDQSPNYLRPKIHILGLSER